MGYLRMTRPYRFELLSLCFYMDLSSVDMYTIHNTSKEYINANYPSNLSTITIYRTLNSYLKIHSLLRYPGFQEKWYCFNNILERLIASDDYAKFVSQDNSMSILRNIDSRKNSPAQFSITWLRDVENVGSCKVKFSDLEIKLLYDLGMIINFLFIDVDRVISLEYFTSLKNNMVLKDLINNYFYNYSNNVENIMADGDHRKYYLSLILERLK